MNKIKKQGLQKGLFITTTMLFDNEPIYNKNIMAGRVYQDNHNLEITISSLSFQKTKKLFKEIYDLKLSEKDYKRVKVSKIDTKKREKNE